LINRVLVVDDYEPWRRHIAAALQETPRWKVVGEVADGLDAVHQAQALAPDLILLDISLPSLNGIEAARRILARDRSSRILFLSEQRSWDIAEEALSTGATGYILKSDAGRELLPAMEAALLGHRTVSTTIAPHLQTAVEPGPRDRAHRRHEAGFYDDDAARLQAYERFAGAALKSGDAVICLAGVERRHALDRRLRLGGYDLDRAIRDGRYLALDAVEESARLLADSAINEPRFWDGAHQLMQTAERAALGDRPRISACGELAPNLWRRGYGDAAVRLEELWDALAGSYDLDIFCPYESACAHRDEGGHVFRKICAVHTTVVTGSHPFHN